MWLRMVRGHYAIQQRIRMRKGAPMSGPKGPSIPWPDRTTTAISLQAVLSLAFSYPQGGRVFESRVKECVKGIQSHVNHMI